MRNHYVFFVLICNLYVFLVHPYTLVHAAVGIAPITSPQTVAEGNPDAQQVCFNVLGTTEIDFTYFFTLSPHTALGE